MSKAKVVIWGASGQALVVAEIVKQADSYELVGFLDNLNPERQGQPFAGATILGGEEQLPSLLAAGINQLILAFGNNVARLRLAERVTVMGFQLVSAVHPQAAVASDAVIGRGSVIKAGACIDPNVQIGENSIIGAGVTIGHGCRLADGTRISGGTNLAGEIRIGRATWLGTGTNVMDRVTIGANCLIGMGSVVLRDIPDGVVAYGVPARVVRPISENDN